MYDLGLLLKELREEKGLTQAQLAEKIHRTYNFNKFQKGWKFREPCGGVCKGSAGIGKQGRKGLSER